MIGHESALSAVLPHSLVQAKLAGNAVTKLFLARVFAGTVFLTVPSKGSFPAWVILFTWASLLIA